MKRIEAQTVDARCVLIDRGPFVCDVHLKSIGCQAVGVESAAINSFEHLFIKTNFKIWRCEATEFCVSQTTRAKDSPALSD